MLLQENENINTEQQASPLRQRISLLVIAVLARKSKTPKRDKEARKEHGVEAGWNAEAGRRTRFSTAALNEAAPACMRSDLALSSSALRSCTRAFFTAARSSRSFLSTASSGGCAGGRPTRHTTQECRVRTRDARTQLHESQRYAPRVWALAAACRDTMSCSSFALSSFMYWILSSWTCCLYATIWRRTSF